MHLNFRFFIVTALIALCETTTSAFSVLPKIIRTSSSSSRLYSATKNNVNEHFDIQQYFNFPLDDWQLQAGEEIINGNNVVTCAPTGAGMFPLKTSTFTIILYHCKIYFRLMLLF